MTDEVQTQLEAQEAPVETIVEEVDPKLEMDSTYTLKSDNWSKDKSIIITVDGTDFDIRNKNVKSLDELKEFAKTVAQEVRYNKSQA